MEQFLRKGEAAREMLDAVGIKVPDTIRDLKRTSAALGAFGALGLRKAEGERRIDPDVSGPALGAIRRYRDAMEIALAQTPVNRVEGAARDAAIFAARRTLAASVPRPVTLTTDMVAGIDAQLGFPAVDPALGLP